MSGMTRDIEDMRCGLMGMTKNGSNLRKNELVTIEKSIRKILEESVNLVNERAYTRR